MPGIFGFYNPNSTKPPAITLEKMLAVNDADPRFQHDTLVENDFAFGYSSLKILTTCQQPVWNNNNERAFFMIGELFDRKGLIQKFASQVKTDEPLSDVELISVLYEKVGNTLFNHLNGAFLILIWESDTKRIIIVNDRLGLYPLYYAQSGAGIIFASNIKALLVDQNVNRTVDQTAIAEFLTFDHILWQRTLLESVKLMPQASIFIFSGQHLEIRPYYHFDYLLEFPIKKDEEYIDELNFLMRQAIQRQMNGNFEKGLLLSGGLDSRYILALITENPDDKLHTFTWSIPNSDDARFAKECAQLAKSDHHFFTLEPDWLVDKAEKAVSLTSGNGNVINLHAFATLEQEAAISPVIYKGFMGDAMFGFGIRPRFWADYNPEIKMEQHLEAYRDYRVLTFDPNIHPQYMTDWFIQNSADNWREDFRSGMLACKSNQMAAQRSFFDLTQRVPRMTINGIDVVRDRCLVRLPFTDNDLVEFSLKVPPYLLYRRELVERTFIQYFPKYAKIPIAQSRLPMMTCAREIWLKNKQLVEWHLRQRGLNWLAGPISRPYKDYNGWFRHELRGMVESILLTPQALGRGYLKPEKIKELVNEQLSGENHAVRIGALITLELAHQQLVD
ncbi:MAG: hypothetical protein BGO78_13575 [Chloroflexi bacterium 44-23]|nr:MAG: hypothetical protein BGO78_13575 [Chloroflexi bacterium 44-23]